MLLLSGRAGEVPFEIRSLDASRRDRIHPCLRDLPDAKYPEPAHFHFRWRLRQSRGVIWKRFWNQTVNAPWLV